MRTLLLAKLTIVAALTLLCCGCRHRILAGTDFLKTVPVTNFDLPNTANPGPNGTAFEGKPRAGNAYDTAIERLDDVLVKPGGAAGKTRLQVRELSLQSSQPVAMTNGHSYNVSVTLDPSKPSTGTMTILETKKGEGTFQSNLEVNFVLSFSSTTGGPPLPDTTHTINLFNDGHDDQTTVHWVSNPQQGNPPCTTVSPKPKGAHDTNQHTGKGNNDLDIYPNGKINENHKNTSRWHRTACI